jgi:hypothetical protein
MTASGGTRTASLSALAMVVCVLSQTALSMVHMSWTSGTERDLQQIRNTIDSGRLDRATVVWQQSSTNLLMRELNQHEIAAVTNGLLNMKTTGVETTGDFDAERTSVTVVLRWISGRTTVVSVGASDRVFVSILLDTDPDFRQMLFSAPRIPSVLRGLLRTSSAENVTFTTRTNAETGLPYRDLIGPSPGGRIRGRSGQEQPTRLRSSR